MSATIILAVIAGIVLLGIALEELFRRTGVPDVLILLIIGLVASVAGVFHVADLRGFDRVFTTAALVLILFDGAVRMKLSELRTALGASLAITLLSFVVTTLLVGGAATLLFGMRLVPALALGAILGGTSSAVVIPMVSVLPIATRTRTVLTLESAFSDVLCIVTTLVLVGISAGAKKVGVREVGVDLFWALGGALILGAVAGWAFAFGLRALRTRRASVLVVGAAVFLCFALAEAAGMYGAIAVLVFGVVLGNAETLAGKRKGAAQLALTEGEKMFLAEAAFLLKVLFFVYLGAALQLDGYEPFVFGGLATVLVFLARPLVVRASLRPKVTSRDDAVVAALLVPKGLAAAVLAGLPRQAGIREGRTIEAVVFGCVLFTISLSALLILVRHRAIVSRAASRVFGAYPLTAPVAAAAGAAPVPAADAPTAVDAPAAVVDAPAAVVAAPDLSAPAAAAEAAPDFAAPAAAGAEADVAHAEAEREQPEPA